MCDGKKRIWAKGIDVYESSDGCIFTNKQQDPVICLRSACNNDTDNHDLGGLEVQWIISVLHVCVYMCVCISIFMKLHNTTSLWT